MQYVALKRRAADLGDARSQADVVMLLLQRDPPDLAAGVAYVKRSAAAADAMGLDALARLHVDGLGVPRDLQRAVQLLRQSLQAGGNPPDSQTLALLATPELQQAARLLDTAARR